MIERASSTPSASLIERVPPHHLEAEMAVLGSILLDGETMGVVVPILRPEDFYRSAHGRIFEIMLTLYDRGEPLDVLLVRQECEQRGVLDDIGEDYLGRLAVAISSPTHAEHYAKLIRGRSIGRRLIRTCTEIQQAAFEQELPAEELLESAESKIFGLSSDSEIAQARGIGGLLEETFQELASEAGLVEGVLTGFHHFDDYTCGLKPGELVIVAGRPSMGKSSFALNVACNAAIGQGVPVAIFSLEMTAQNIAKNMICSQTRFDAQRFRRRSGRMISLEERADLAEKVQPLQDAKIFIDDSATLSPTTLRAKARRLKEKHGLGLLIVDYLQLMEAGVGVRRLDNRQQEIAYISRSLKGLSRELKLPVMALSQLNREADKREGKRPGEKGRPKLSDLRESGALEQDADVICLLYRPWYYTRDEGERHEACMIIAKQRNGPTGDVRLHFHDKWMRFDNPVTQGMA